MEALDTLNLTALALYLGSGLVLVLAILAVLMPLLRRLGPDPQERAWKLLEQYHREKR
jgi:hypothetical protein